MTLRPRGLIGQRGSDIGLWVSKPNKNVLICSDDDMLVSPTNPNLAFLIKGQVDVASAAQQVTVAFGTTLRRAPIVWAQIIRSGQTLIPALQYDTALKTGGGAGARFEVTPSTTNFVLRNLKNVAYTFQYIVLHYPVA